MRKARKIPKSVDRRLQRRVRDRIIEEQTLSGVLLGSLLGAALGTGAYLAIWKFEAIPLVAFLVPGIVAGLVVRFSGKAFEIPYRLLCGLVTFLTLWLTAWYIDDNPLTVVLALPNALIAAALSRRGLTFEQEKAIYRYRMGIDDR